MKNMKSIGRYLLLVSSFSVFPYLTFAQVERKSMVVKLDGQEKEKVVFALSEQPKYWVSNNELHIQTLSGESDRISEYALSSVKEISFLNEQTQSNESLSSVELSVSPNPAQDYITVSGLTPNSTVVLLDASGLLMEHYFVEDSQGVTILVSHLPKGVYLLKINDKPYKFIKK
ncbi:MAG: T9SS type A sorting domain-containing protein [Paludibacteraceae bacterium]|nr:T9SS type A sorting domain-containing protein [Paludibacteraceae bacterium]